MGRLVRRTESHPGERRHNCHPWLGRGPGRAAWLAELWEEQVRQRGSCPPHCSCWAPFHSLLAFSASPSWPTAPRSRRPTHPFASPVPVVPSEPSPRDGQLVGVIRPLAFSPRPRASNASLIADSG